jgi:hypothetical protein
MCPDLAPDAIGKILLKKLADKAKDGFGEEEDSRQALMGPCPDGQGNHS